MHPPEIFSGRKSAAVLNAGIAAAGMETVALSQLDLIVPPVEFGKQMAVDQFPDLGIGKTVLRTGFIAERRLVRRGFPEIFRMGLLKI